MIDKDTVRRFKSVLCLNGALPNSDFFQNFLSLPIIAADGAANYLLDMGINLDYIVGDLDSFRMSDYDCSNINIIRYKNQNYNDFEKCLLVMKKENLFPTLILGIFGGEPDHVINNMNCMMKFSRKYSIMFYDEHSSGKAKWGRPVSKTSSFVGKKDDIISILPYPKAVISSKGLIWDLNKQELSQDGKSSIRNRISDKYVDINIHSGKVIIITDSILP